VRQRFVRRMQAPLAWTLNQGASSVAVAVIALDEADRVVVVRQYRHPVGFQLIEPPAGLLDADGESWLGAAQRGASRSPPARPTRGPSS